MRNRFIFFLCSLFLVLASCSQGNKKTENGGDESSSVSSTVRGETKSEQPQQLAGNEDFYVFLDKFSNEESFQLNRIKFPIAVVVPDTGHQGMAPMEETVGKYEWEMLDLTYDSTYATREYDTYYQTVRFTGDTAVVEIRGINNGIYADYYFKMIDAEWYLVTLKEASF